MNSTNINKIIGYLLLSVGLLLIIFPLYQAYTISLGKGLPVQIFKQEKIDAARPNNPLDVQQQMQKALIAVLPAELINSTLNLASWMILMWVLIYGGGKMAGLGIQLIK